MTERRRVEAVSPFAQAMGYCRALRVGDTIHVSGTAPIMADGGDPPTDGYGQARRCLEIIVAALEELGAGADDVVRTRVFITDPRGHRRDRPRARRGVRRGPAGLGDPCDRGPARPALARRDRGRRNPRLSLASGGAGSTRRAPAAFLRRAAASASAGRPAGASPGTRWLGKSFRPPGRGRGRTCSRSGAQEAAAPMVAGVERAALAASSTSAPIPERTSKPRDLTSQCGTWSPAACSSSPTTIARRRVPSERAAGGSGRRVERRDHGRANPFSDRARSKFDTSHRR